MKFLVIVFFSLALFTTSAYAQNLKKHKVEKGETVTTIAKKYQITPYDIYRLNPDAKNGLKLESILLIPTAPVKPLPSNTPVQEKPTKVANSVHTVLAKETLFSIAKKYGVTVADLEKANVEALKGGLKTGQSLVIPIKGSGVAAQAKTVEKQEAKKNEPSYLFHTVAAGDTKYGIAKKYGMSLQLLEELNPEVKDTLPLGFKLKLAKNTVIAEAKIPETAKEAAATTANVISAPQGVNDLYTVKSKETIYSISKDNNISEEQLIALNPELKEGGLKEGMLLHLGAPSGSVILPVSKTQITNLSSTLKKSESKSLALLLPFNMYRLDNAEEKSKLLQGDKFLNLTLDFYAGAMIAIDSAKTLGLPLKVSILDAKETSRSSEIASLKSNLSGVNAIVGPFFQSNAESAAAMFPNAVVVSPMAKESGQAYSNLYHSIPSDEAMRKAMLSYLRSKNGNVIAIVDSKKASSKQFIKANYPEVRILEGGITGNGIHALLSKEKTNYVILDTETLTTVTGVTKMLEEAMVDNTIQLAVLDKNEKLDNDEVPLARLIKLKMMYPSITNDADTPESQLFEKIFRQKNGYQPTQYATRGFDVTFDMILRLFQQEDIKTVMATKASDEVENKFSYTALNGGNYNTGVYIMQYTDGPAVQQAP
jgi:LysM repeat protein